MMKYQIPRLNQSDAPQDNKGVQTPLFNPADTPGYQLASSAVQFEPGYWELIIACMAELCASTLEIDTPGGDATPFLPPPNDIREIQWMKDTRIRKAWLKACKKEVQSLIQAGTFSIKDPKPSEPITPTMETNYIKIPSDGTPNKLNVAS